MTRSSKTKLQILFVTRRFPPATGGMERFAYDVYTSLKDKADISLLKWGGVSNLYLVVVIPYFFVVSCWKLLTKPIDVLHMQDGVMSIMGVVLKFIFRKPLVVVIHGLDVTYNNGLYQFLIRRSLTAADSIICISSAAADEVIARGIDDSKVEVIPLGIYDDLFSGSADTSKKKLAALLNDSTLTNKTILTSVGRLVKRKGVDWFVRNVLSELAAIDNDFVYLVAGDGIEKETIEQSIKKHKLGDAVRLLGYIDDEQRDALYNAADIFVMPNIPVPGDLEGFGRVLLEAATCETVVVASGIEGIRDAITDGENGILLTTKDKKAYLDTISDLMANPQKRKKIVKKSRQYTLKQYGWDRISNLYLEQYHQLTSKGKPADEKA